MNKFDYHMHTAYSPDGHETPETMVEAAISLGLEEIALTDHCDFMFRDRPFPSNIDFCEYEEMLRGLKEKYAGKINIIFGVEIGVNGYSNETVKKMVKNYGFEFVIASAHDVRGADIFSGTFYDGKTKREAYSEYFESLLESAKNIEDYDVIGHLDFISRYGRYADATVKYYDYRAVIDELLKTIISKGKGIELNTSGYRYGLGFVYPSMEILKRYKELGGEIITVGSDAHRSEDVARDFDKAEEIIKTAGFTAVCRFQGKKPVFVDL